MPALALMQRGSVNLKSKLASRCPINRRCSAVIKIYTVTSTLAQALELKGADICCAVRPCTPKLVARRTRTKAKAKGSNLVLPEQFSTALDEKTKRQLLVQAAVSGKKKEVQKAMKLAASLSKPSQEGFVTALVRSSAFKAALHAVARLKTGTACLGAEQRSQERAVAQLLRERNLKAAAQFADGNPALQRKVVNAALDARNVIAAEDFACKFGIDISTGAKAVTSQHNTAFAMVPLSVNMLAGVRKLSVLRTALTRASLLAIDIECAQDGPKPTNQLISTLQLAVYTAKHGAGTRTTVHPENLAAKHRPIDVFILDLLLWPEDSIVKLSRELEPYFTSNSITKLGLDLASDLQMLAVKCPKFGAFKAVNRCLDLQAVWTAYKKGLHDSSGKDAFVDQKVGLSSMSQELLGKPLEKDLQASKWGQRPLSGEQRKYAALNAAIQPVLLANLSRAGKGLNQGDLGQLHFDWRPSASQPVVGTGKGGGGNVAKVGGSGKSKIAGGSYKHDSEKVSGSGKRGKGAQARVTGKV